MSHCLPIFKALPNTSGVAFMLHTHSLLQYFYVTSLALASLGCNQEQYEESHDLGSQEQFVTLLILSPSLGTLGSLRISSQRLLLRPCAV